MVGIAVSFLFAKLFYYAVFDGGINILALIAYRLSLIAYVMALGIVVNDDIVLISFFLRNLEAGLSLL